MSEMFAIILGWNNGKDLNKRLLAGNNRTNINAGAGLSGQLHQIVMDWTSIGVVSLICILIINTIS